MGLPAIVLAESLPAIFEADLAAAGDYAQASLSPATRRAYRADFAAFRTWCAERHLEPLPASAETVCAYVASEATRLKPSSLNRRIASIKYGHDLAGLPIPTDDKRLKKTMAGIRRTVGSAPVKKAPATADLIMLMVATLGDDPKGLRDRALLLLGFGGGFRRSELTALDVPDLQQSEEGFRVSIRRSKTDQEGRGTIKAIIRGTRACPVRAVKAWLEAAGITEGPIFRPVGKGGHVGSERLQNRTVASVVKETAERAGLDPAIFSGHSLRSGFLTSAAKRGASVWKMMEVSGHKSVDTLAGYVRDGELFKDHAAAGLL